jgi:uncharacterized membrane protein YccF (DUF307 family)
MTDAAGSEPGRRDRLKEKARRYETTGKSWAGYGWFMTGGTFLPLPIFVGGYLVNVSLVGRPLAERIYRGGLFLTTMGQDPPGKDKLEARAEKADGDKESLPKRLRRYTPPGLLARREKQVPVVLRGLWFVLVGWWLGALWVIVAWSFLLLPYPLLDAIQGMLNDLPSVMTLALPSG